MQPFPLFCGLLLLVFLFLFLASRGESPPGPFRCAASLLFFRVLFPLFGEQCLADGKALRHLRRRDPAAYREEAAALLMDRIAVFLVFLFLAAFAGLVSSLADGEEAVLSLERPKPSDPSREEELIVREEGAEETSVRVSVSARSLLPEEEEAAFAALLSALPGRILGANETLDFVTDDLDLPASVEGFPFRLTYRSGDPEVLGADGQVRLEALAEGERRTVLLSVEGEGSGQTHTGEIAVSVCRSEPLEAEKRQQAVLEALRQQDKATLYESRLLLPKEAGGRKLSFYRPGKDTGRVLFALLVLLGILSWLEAGQRAERAEETRERELALSFPHLVSLLLLYTGAGMSLRTAFERSARRLSGSGRGALLEEVEILCNELRSGIPEEQAYQRLGERTGVRQYMRLASLLAQNVRKGNDTLLAALRAEADAAYAERRDTARVLGEEAGTKLLLPMMLLLAASILPVILPAMWTFG